MPLVDNYKAVLYDDYRLPNTIDTVTPKFEILILLD